jgi:hypothetical protein
LEFGIRNSECAPDLPYSEFKILNSEAKAHEEAEPHWKMISPIGIIAEVIVFLFGMSIGWQLTKPESGEIAVGWREVWRHGPSPLYYRNPKSGRVLFGAFGGFLAAWVFARWETTSTQRR